MHGEARNTSALEADVVLTVTRSDNAVVFNQTFAALAPGASVPFTVTDASAPVGNIRYDAASNLGATASAQIQVRNGNVAASAAFDVTDLVLGQTVNLNTTLQNVLSDTQGIVSVDWADGLIETFVLEQGQTLNLSHSYTPTAAGNFAPNVALSGDASGSINIAAVQVRDESATASATTSGKTRSSAIVRTDAAELTLALTNTHDYSVPLQVNYVVNSEPIIGSQLLTLAPHTAQTLSIPLKQLDAGNHTAVFSITHAQLGTLQVVVDKETFALVDPITTVQLQTITGDSTADGLVPIYITVSSAAASDEIAYGTVLISGALDLTQRFALTPGQSLALTPTLALAGRNGVQAINVQLVDSLGNIVQQKAVQVQAAPRPAPNAKLLSLSADPANAGGSVTLHATVRNDGDDGGCGA